MAECLTLDFGTILQYYGDNWDDLCCYKVPSQTYDDFIEGLTEYYNNSCVKDKVFSDYVTQLYNNCLSGGSGGGCACVTGGTADDSTSTLTFTNTTGGTFTVTNSALLFNDAYVSGGTLDAATGIVTFTNTTGGTFTVSGFDGFTSFWSANTDSSISPSGSNATTSVNIKGNLGVSGDTNIHGTLSAATAIKSDKIFDEELIYGSVVIVSSAAGRLGQSNELYYDITNKVLSASTLCATTASILGNTSIAGVLGVSGATNIAGTLSALSHTNLGSILGVSGKTYLGDVAAAGGSYTYDRILVAQSNNAVEYLTTAELKADIGDADYWSANTDGSISPSGGSSNITRVRISGSTDIKQNLGVSGKTYFDDNVNILQSKRIYFGYDNNSNTSIRETSGNLRIESDDDILLYADDDVKISVGNSDQYAIFDGGVQSLIIGGTAIPTARLTLTHIADTQQTVSFADNGAECADHPVYADMLSIQDTGIQKLVFGETTFEEGSTHTFQIFATPVSLPEETWSSDLVLGGYKAGDACASEVLRIFNNTRVGILNRTPSYTLDVTGDIRCTDDLFVNDDATIAGGLGVSGRTYLGTVDNATPTPTSAERILVRQTSGEIESITKAQLTGLTEQYWEVDGTGTGLKPSGTTTNIHLPSTLGVTGDTTVGGDIYLPNTSKVIFNSPTHNDIWIEANNNQMTIESDNIFLVKVDNSAEIKGAAGGFPFTLDAGGTDIYTFNVDSTPQIDVIGELVISAQTITTKSVPTSLADDTGSGEIVTFGSNTSGMVAGKLYYLDAAGAWVLADADGVADGGSQLLGIALDAAASDGVLLRGFFDVTTYLGPGSFNQGVPVYVSTDVGKIAITQPSGTGDFVRVVGYCTDTANIIYFNPDGTYITVA